MKRFAIVVVLGVLFGLAAPAWAAVQMYVDSAPNVYGSPAWTPWWDATKPDVVAGTFTNLRTGTYPGTTVIDPYDEIVYSTGDLGKRLHWIYWLPGETVANLTDRFEVKWVIDWDGEAWTLDATNNWVLDDPSQGWAAPTRWEDYSGGVIGSLGFAWWATDDDALPTSTDGNPYNETDQADIDALRDMVLGEQTYAIGMVRYREEPGDEWEYTTLRVDVAPEPATVVIWTVLGGLAIVLPWWRRRKAA
ncbi:MAG: hypothetical protein JW809_10740 [Pirellulales bacterium]|nr:hypothetical protein [Pirellulales bacterium]